MTIEQKPFEQNIVDNPSLRPSVPPEARGVFSVSEEERRRVISEAAPVWEEMEHLGNHPPGRELVLGAHYRGILGLADEGHPLAHTIAHAFLERGGSSHQLITKLTPSVLHDIIKWSAWGSERTLSSDYFLYSVGWKRLVKDLYEEARYEWQDARMHDGVIENSKRPVKSRLALEATNKIYDMMHTFFTNTTVFNRYATVQAVGTALLGNTGVTHLDLASGVLLGPRGLAANNKGWNASFDSTQDNTPGQWFSARLTEKMRYRAVAVDRQDPTDPRVKLWAISCLRPSELRGEKFDERIELEHILAQVPPSDVRFVQGDVMDLGALMRGGHIHRGQFNLITGFTFLYQYTEEKIAEFMSQLQDIASKETIILIQDFAVIDEADPTRLRFVEMYPEGGKAYRTFATGARWNWQWKEVFIFADGRCREVWPGKHFEEVFDPVNRS